MEVPNLLEPDEVGDGESGARIARVHSVTEDDPRMETSAYDCHDTRSVRYVHAISARIATAPVHYTLTYSAAFCHE